MREEADDHQQDGDGHRATGPDPAHFLDHAAATSRVLVLVRAVNRAASRPRRTYSTSSSMSSSRTWPSRARVILAAPSSRENNPPGRASGILWHSAPRSVASSASAASVNDAVGRRSARRRPNKSLTLK